MPKFVCSYAHDTAMKTRKPSTARVHLSDGRVLTFTDQTLAYHTWLTLPRGIRAAFRGQGDTRPIQPWDYADQP
ncbi:MAG: hypothetical protein IH623_12725 [Verrucomicrobia bacterium]|nr:hypothetical protein [Verrucomicrobiota bacterium]